MSVSTWLLWMVLAVSTSGLEEAPPGQIAGAADRLSVTELSEASLQALSDAASARDVLRAVKPVGDALADTFELMTAHRQAIRRIQHARGAVSPFLNSKGEAMRLTALAFDSSFAGLEHAWRTSLRADDALLRAKSKDELASAVSLASEAAAEADDAWRLLPMAAVGLAHAFVDDGRLLNGKIAWLRITAAERARLIANLKTMFPNRPEKGDRHVVDAAVSLLLQFLAGNLKASDEEAGKK